MYRDWAKILYDTPQNPYVNIFPRLDVDLDENGRPDGFRTDGDVVDRKDGVVESGGVSYTTGAGGKICSVYGLGGLEKGVNTFSLYTKGHAGSIKVIFTFHSATDMVKEYVFPATTADWTKHDTALVIPNVSTCDIQIQALNLGTAPIKVSGMFLAKAADSVAFKAHSVTASAGPNGTITPSGVVQLIFGASQSFAMTPNDGYKVADVLVDSVSVGPVSTYGFPSVTADHKISALFSQIKKPVVTTAGATELTPTSVRFNGTVNPNGLVTTYRFEFGLTSSYGVATPMLTAPAGNTLTQVSNLINNLLPGTTYHYRIAATNSDGSAYGNDTVFATLPSIPVVRAVAGPHGTITPSGIIPVAFGGRQDFVISPDKGYRVDSVVVDDSLVGAATSYDLSDVIKDETISASFIAVPTTSVEQLDNVIPRAFVLYQNYPNPFNPSTTIRFAMPERSFVTLTIFNVLGAEVASLIARDLGPGYFSVRWDAEVTSGNCTSSNYGREMYVETKKMVLLR